MLAQKNPAALWLAKRCTFSMEITRDEARSLQMRMRNAELYLKEATIIYRFHQLAARFPELTSKFERQPAPICSTPSTGASFQLITRRVSDDAKLLRFTSLRWLELSLLSKRTIIDCT